MSWSLLCMCCKEQLPLLFIVQKNNVWPGISVEDLGHIVCDGQHVLGLYVFIYMLYIVHKQICWTWEGKSVETSLGKWSIMPCHAFGDNVKPGADALKQTLKAITYVICIMQHINRYHRTAPCHNSTILRQESVLPRCHLEQMHGKCDWCPRRGNLCHWLTREVPLEPKNQTHPKYLHIHKIRTHSSTKSPDVNVLYVVCAHI